MSPSHLRLYTPNRNRSALLILSVVYFPVNVSRVRVFKSWKLYTLSLRLPLNYLFKLKLSELDPITILVSIPNFSLISSSLVMNVTNYISNDFHVSVIGCQTNRLMLQYYLFSGSLLYSGVLQEFIQDQYVISLYWIHPMSHCDIMPSNGIYTLSLLRFFSVYFHKSVVWYHYYICNLVKSVRV